MSEAVAAPLPAPHSTRSRAFTREVWIERLARFSASGLIATLVRRPGWLIAAPLRPR
jgi:hypothetical protein